MMNSKPKELRRSETGLEIVWSDGTRDVFEYRWLRLSCQCAVCRELKTPLDERQPFFQRAISFRSMESVGNYAVAVMWGDGHRSIFSFEKLASARKASDARMTSEAQA